MTQSEQSTDTGASASYRWRYSFTENTNYRILFVEDDKLDQMAFSRLVEQQHLPYDYQLVASVAQARILLKNTQFDIIISDYSLGDGTALDILDLAPGIPVIVVTGAGNEEVAVKAWRAGAYDYLTKDIDRNYLTALPITVENALQYKRAAEKLRLLSGAMMSIDESIFITDLDDRIIFVNKAFCKTYRYQEQEVLGKNSGILWMTKLQKGNTRSVFRMQTADGNWHIGFYHKRKDDSIFPVSMSRSIVKNAAGIQVAIVGTVQDIAERLVVEQELRKANINLKEQCQQKSSLAIAVAQTLERLLADSNIKSSRPCDNFPCSSLDAAKQVVRDFLCISQLAAGQYDLDLADTNLTQIITIALQPLLPLVRANNVDLIASEMNQHLTVRADCPKLAYAVTNIVSTAMLFAPPHGSIEIKTNTSGDEVIVTVQVNPAHAGNHPKTHKITNPEESLEQLPWRNQDDYPLALTAARQLIEMHDGRLWTENGQQKTNIYFALPLAPTHTMADTIPAAISSRS